MPDEWSDVERELNSGSGGYYSPVCRKAGKKPCPADCKEHIPLGSSEEIVIVSYVKWTSGDAEYQIKGKDNQSIGYTWRFRLSTDKVWDVANRNRKVLLQGLHPGGKPDTVPARFRVTNVGRLGNSPATKVEFIENVPKEKLEDVPF